MPYLHYYYPARALRQLGHTVDETGIYGAGYDFAFMMDNTWRQPRPTNAWVKSGIEGIGWLYPYPVGFWAVDCDNHWPHHRLNREADVVFVDTHDWVQKYREWFPRVEWLPYACDPEIHKEIETPELYDIGFIGMYEQHRGHRLKALEDKGFKLRIHDSRTQGLLTWPQTLQFIAECRMIFNYSICTGMNMRLYETLSMGKLLLTNRKGSEPDIYFKDGEHLAVYEDDYETNKDLLEKARYYLENENERRRVAKSGQHLVHEKHTYVHRMQGVIKAILG